MKNKGKDRREKNNAVAAPSVALTGHRRKNRRQVEVGDNEVLLKPAEFETLVALVIQRGRPGSGYLAAPTAKERLGLERCGDEPITSAMLRATVSVQRISRLRRALGEWADKVLERGVGAEYRLVSADAIVIDESFLELTGNIFNVLPAIAVINELRTSYGIVERSQRKPADTGR